MSLALSTYEMNRAPDGHAAYEGLKIAKPGQRFLHTSCSSPVARSLFSVQRGVFMALGRVHVKAHLMPCRTVDSALSEKFVREVSLPFSGRLSISVQVTTT